MAAMTVDALYFTGDPEADAFLGREPLALLIGFALDQQVTVQKAFSGPLDLRKRIGHLDAAKIAAMPPGCGPRPAMRTICAGASRRCPASAR